MQKQDYFFTVNARHAAERGPLTGITFNLIEEYSLTPWR
jgi:hypothetical protein